MRKFIIPFVFVLSLITAARLLLAQRTQPE